MSTHIVSMLSMCCRSDAFPSPSPLVFPLLTSAGSASAAPASVSSSP